MQAKVLRWFVLAIGILALAGCQHNQSAGANLTPVPPPQPFIFYDETGEPSGETAPLSEVEFREIMDWVAGQTPERVWLIRVRPSPQKRLRNDMVAYLVPDEATSRIRAGRAYNIPASRRRTGIPSPWRYAQVSMPNHDFTEVLTKPPVTEMPFEWPMIRDLNSKETSAMSKQEVIAIADFVRNPSSYRHTPTVPDKGWEEETAHGIFQSPILHIYRAGD